MQRTKIEYLTHTYNPIAMRCTPVSAGCANCWHLAMAKRLAKNPLLDEVPREAYAGGKPILNPAELDAPLHLKKPARIGVQFMGDLFHGNVSGQFVQAVFSTMAATPWHTYFVLTKRPKRMLDIITGWQELGLTLREGCGAVLPNVWLGMSCEDQKTADERIPILLKIPAAHRWVSIEPLLEDIELGKLSDPNISWVVAGCETGPKARPCDLFWIKSIRYQCEAQGLPFYYKNNDGMVDGKEWREIP